MMTLLENGNISPFDRGVGWRSICIEIDQRSSSYVP